MHYMLITHLTRIEINQVILEFPSYCWYVVQWNKRLQKPLMSWLMWKLVLKLINKECKKNPVHFTKKKIKINLERLRDLHGHYIRDSETKKNCVELCCNPLQPRCIHERPRVHWKNFFKNNWYIFLLCEMTK